MEENSQRHLQNTDIFRWSLTGTTKIFPLDYSLEELSRELGKDSNTIRKYLRSPQALDGILEEILYPPNYQDKLGKNPTPIPVETFRFLSAFFKTVFSKTDNTFHNIFRENHCSSHPGKERQQFLLELYKELRDSLLNGETTDDIFCRHALFSSICFQRFSIDDIWKNNIDFRYQQLRKLSRNVSPQGQLQVLEKMLYALDDGILILKRMSATKHKTALPFRENLKDMIQALLFNRKATQEEKSDLAFYEIENILISDNITMQEAFKKLGAPILQKDKADFQKQVRKAYLVNLTQKVGVSEFEQEYSKLQKYLLTSQNVDETWIDEQILTQGKQICQSIIERCTYKFSCPQEEKYLDYNSALIRHIISKYLTSEIKKIEEYIEHTFRAVAAFMTYMDYKTYEMTAYYTAMYQRSSLICETKQPSGHVDIYRKKAFDMVDECNKIWTFIVGGSTALFDKETLHIDQVEDLYQKIIEGTKYFDLKLPAESLSHYQGLINRYTEFIDNLDNQIPPAPIIEFSAYIHQKLLYRALQKCIETASDPIKKDIATYFANQV